MYCSVSNIKNWLLNDPILDYLKLYGDKNKQSSTFFNQCDFSSFILDMGNKYEEVVVNNLINKCEINELSYCTVERKTGYQSTKEALAKKIDVIFQAQVKDWNRNVTGYPDIMIKKSALMKIFDMSNVNDKIKVKLNAIKDNDYIIIDIKYSSLDSTDGILDEKSKYHRYIKSQICMYSILGKCKPNLAFIISKDLSSIVTPIAFFIDEPLVIDCTKGVNWYFKVIKEGMNWSLDKEEDVYQILPNMNNVYDSEWRDYKREIAIKYKEISLISGIGDNLRDKLRSNNIYTYDNPLFIETLGKCIDKESKMFKRICIIRDNLLNPTNILFKNELSSLTSTTYVYIDIETCTKFTLTNENRNYLISISIHYNGVSKCFIVDELSQANEEVIINEFKNELQMLSKDKDIVLVHYSSVEDKFFKRINIDYPSIDLYSILTNEFDKVNEDVVKLCVYDLSLKSVVNKLKDVYGECKIKNGLEVLAAYQKEINDEIKNEIIKYNIADCIALQVLHSYFIQIKLLI
jgi:hypothetical protein